MQQCGTSTDLAGDDAKMKQQIKQTLREIAEKAPKKLNHDNYSLLPA